MSDVQKVISTGVKANPGRVRKVLRKYELRHCEFILDKEGYLQAVGTKPEELLGYPHNMPMAVPIGEVPKQKVNSDDRAYWLDLVPIYMKKGDEGFNALLQELASCIETPMTLLAVGWTGDVCECASWVWRIEPGTRQVETLGTGFVTR